MGAAPAHRRRLGALPQRDGGRECHLQLDVPAGLRPLRRAARPLLVCAGGDEQLALAVLPQGRGEADGRVRALGAHVPPHDGDGARAVRGSRRVVLGGCVGRCEWQRVKRHAPAAADARVGRSHRDGGLPSLQRRPLPRHHQCDRDGGGGHAARPRHRPARGAQQACDGHGVAAGRGGRRRGRAPRRAQGAAARGARDGQPVRGAEARRGGHGSGPPGVADAGAGPHGATLRPVHGHSRGFCLPRGRRLVL
mmetsp:Transcript_16295/g.56977  ORF Transcript_16295/g.56977 Transcript_16295/m.56977 type:complete len:251 (+) Transcript_16295:628-1380(+)